MSVLLRTAAYHYAEETISIPTALPVWGVTVSDTVGLCLTLLSSVSLRLFDSRSAFN